MRNSSHVSYSLWIGVRWAPCDSSCGCRATHLRPHIAHGPVHLSPLVSEASMNIHGVGGGVLHFISFPSYGTSQLSSSSPCSQSWWCQNAPLASWDSVFKELNSLVHGTNCWAVVMAPGAKGSLGFAMSFNYHLILPVSNFFMSTEITTAIPNRLSYDDPKT